MFLEGFPEVLFEAFLEASPEAFRKAFPIARSSFIHSSLRILRIAEHVFRLERIFIFMNTIFTQKRIFFGQFYAMTETSANQIFVYKLL